ncbi:Hint domain-containing protein [Paracoccus cavernae]|uniref:Hint domain-containing protein n=1 Tax=Paracoccus cavernae TaxID=1571207 RepID=A0ABT8D476_9RHOB|nr:Hint domain-containing protein [Paracoccus cavernae]
MALITALDPGISLDVNLELVNTGNLDLLNAFGSAETVSSYDTGAGDKSLQSGEELGVSTVEGTSLSGTYLGDVTLSTLNTTILNVPLVASLAVKINPIEGELYQSDTGELYMISEEPVNDARISVTATLTVLGVPTTISLPLGDLDAWLRTFPVAGDLLAGVTNLTQLVLDTVVVSMDYDPAGTMIVCFTRGTLIETEYGLRAIEDLKAGDRVYTRDNGLKPISWIGASKLTGAALAAKANLRPIRIKAGALAPKVPSADLMVSPQHRILVRSKLAQRMFGTDEVLVAAKQLLQIEGIDIVEGLSEVEYFHMLFDQHEIVLSNGAETESLYTGKQALKSLGAAAREEIFAIFPELMGAEDVAQGARMLLSGRQARRLAVRHVQNNRDLVM